VEERWIEKVPERSEKYLVARIGVSGLFGQFDYDICPFNDGKRKKLGGPPLMLIYGSNGSGKTTILKLLWHLLSPSRTSGHRTYIATIPFRRFSVTLGDGVEIVATKETGLVGNYSISVWKSGRSVVEQSYRYNMDEKEVRAVGEQSPGIQVISDPDAPENQQHFYYVDFGTAQVPPDKYLAYLAERDIRPFLLGDDRKMNVDDEVASYPRARRVARDRPITDIDPIAAELATAMHRTTDWLRQQVLSGAVAGSETADDIYRGVLTQISKVTEPTDVLDIGTLRERLSEIDVRTRRFSEFGLVPHLDSKPLLALLKRVDSSRHVLVASILDPYLNGQIARLNSLQDTETLVRTFVNHLNNYFTKKSVTFTPGRGLEIRGPDNAVLLPIRLSSGERQLLLLLCNALLARPATSLFLIDEPEISLNAKWQRRLVQTLLDCVDTSSVQFIMATHSMYVFSLRR